MFTLRAWEIETHDSVSHEVVDLGRSPILLDNYGNFILAAKRPDFIYIIYCCEAAVKREIIMKTPNPRTFHREAAKNIKKWNIGRGSQNFNFNLPSQNFNLPRDST